MNSPQSITQLPGPQGLPLVGNLLQIDLQKLHTILEAWADTYGDVYHFKLGSKMVVAISDSSLIQAILRDRPQNYRRFRSIASVGGELGVNGVFAAEGEEWQRQRQLTTQAFSQECLRRFFPQMSKITRRLELRWKNAAETGQIIDARKDFMRFTVDITTNLAFGYDINLLGQENDSFQSHLEKLLPIINRRANAPFPYWHFVKTPSDRAMEKSLGIIKDTIRGFIEQTRQKFQSQDASKIQPANFLESLLLARDEKGAYLSDAEIEGNIITILIAGEETTAYTLAWLVYLLTENPEVQNKIQAEIDAVLSDDNTLTDWETVEKLNYIEAVAHETMRLKSVAPLIFMEPNNDVEIAGTLIPKGTFLMLVNRYSALQDKNFTDAHLFKPERWLADKTDKTNHNRNANTPFGAGPRFCPGRSLALLEIKMAVAMLCKNFSLTRVGRRSVQEVFSFTMMPDELLIKLESKSLQP